MTTRHPQYFVQGMGISYYGNTEGDSGRYFVTVDIRREDLVRMGRQPA